MPSEEGIRPAVMVSGAQPHAGAMLLLTQQRAKPPTDEPVQGAKRVAIGMLEVRKPAPQSPVQIINDGGFQGSCRLKVKITPPYLS
jgi:hypothetical protein